MLGDLLFRLRCLLRRTPAEDALDEELRSHLEHQTQKYVAAGLSVEDARRKARIALGGMEQTKERTREAWGLTWLEHLAQDVRYGLRQLRKNPGFTSIAVLTLALGIGANTGIFSVIYGVLLKSLPYKNGDRLVLIHQAAPLAHVDDMRFSVKEINDYREQSHTLESVVEHHSMSFILYGRKEPERVQTSVVSPNFFDVLGVTPILGRTFVAADDLPGAEAVLVLSNKYWRRSFGADTGIVGRVFQMNNRPHRVIGVLPSIPQYPVESDVYMPTSACPFRSSPGMLNDRTGRMMDVFCTLKPGVTLKQAQADVATVATNLQREYPAAYPATSGYTAQAASLRNELTNRAKPTFLLLLATASFVLLIGCANVANMGLARMVRREREMAVRAALGASRSRLIRQTLTESTLLSLAGGAAGLLLGSVALKLLVAFAAKLTNRASEIKIDGWVLLFTFLVSIATGLAFGLAPAFFSSRRDLSASIKEGAGLGTSGGPKHHIIRSVLIVAQVAASFVLLIGAGLMLRSLVKLENVNPGFNPEGVLVMRTSPDWSKYDTNDKIRGHNKRLIEAIESQPGISSAALASTFPMDPSGITFGPMMTNDFTIEGRVRNDKQPKPVADFRTVTPGYFPTVEIPLVAGRTFTEADNEDAPAVVIINQSMARHRWPDENPVGKRVSIDGGKHWATIVGVVGDVRQYGLDRQPTDELYVAEAQNPMANNLLVRTSGDPASLATMLRDVVHKVDPDTAVDRVVTLEQARNDSITTPRLTSYLLALFAGLALLITVAGITGVMALSVGQRTHEMGIRLALGASKGQVMGLVVRNGMALVGFGLAIGVIGAMVATRLLSALLFAVQPTDVVTFILVSTALLGTAAVACFVPASRLTRIDPVKSLRFE